MASSTQGQRIYDLRLKKRYTQEYLAEQLGTTKQAIYKYEKDIVQNIPDGKLFRLAQILDCSVAYLKCLSDEIGSAPMDNPFAAPSRSSAPTSDELFATSRSLMDILPRLTDEECRSVLSYARFLLAQHG